MKHKRQAYLLCGGPYHGNKVPLTPPGSTLTFTVKGQTGSYQPQGIATAKWVPASDLLKE